MNKNTLAKVNDWWGDEEDESPTGFARVLRSGQLDQGRVILRMVGSKGVLTLNDDGTWEFHETRK